MANAAQWQHGRRGQDGWGKYTRRRKWYRDAELVEITPSTDITPSHTPSLEGKAPSKSASSGTDVPTTPESPPKYSDVMADDSASTKSSAKSSSRRSGLSKRTSIQEEEDELLSPGHRPRLDRDGDWGIGDDARMGLE
jgi:hypothetical protein